MSLGTANEFIFSLTSERGQITVVQQSVSGMWHWQTKLHSLNQGSGAPRI